MGGNTTPQGANSGNALTNLFLSNQATPRIATSPVSAPQSLIGQGGSTPQMPSSGSSKSPVSYTPVNTNPMNLPPQYAAAQEQFMASHPPTFTPDQYNPGYGTMKSWQGGNSGGGDMATQGGFVNNYVSAPQPVQQTPYQPSNAAIMAALINQQARK